MSVQASAFRSPVESQLAQSASLSESQQKTETRSIMGAIDLASGKVYEIKKVNNHYQLVEITEENTRQQVVNFFNKTQRASANGSAKIPQYEIRSKGSNSKPMGIDEINKALKKQKANANIDSAFNKLQNPNNTTADLTQAFKAFFEPSGLTVREIHQQENKHKQKRVDREFESDFSWSHSSVSDDDTAPQAHKPVHVFHKEGAVIEEVNDDDNDDDLLPPAAATASCAAAVRNSDKNTTTVEVESNM